jgi:serine/threonine protein kinase
MENLCLRVDNFSKYFNLGPILGKGAFGIVQRALVNPATIHELGRKFPPVVAVKTMVIKPSHLNQAIIELLALKELDIPNVSKYYGCFTQDPQSNTSVTVYVVMEMISGKTLQTMLKEKFNRQDPRLPMMLYKIALALHRIHKHGFAHRDLKAHNIMVDDSGTVWEPTIIDFGLSCMKGPYGTGNSRSICHNYAGSPNYVDPYMIRFVRITGNSTYLMRILMMSDWWAFAVLVHLIYTNKNVLVLADESNDIWTLLQTKANYVINPKMATAPKEIHDIVHNIISNHDNIKNRFVGSQIVNILSDLVGVQKADRIIEESWEWEQDY